MILIHLLIGVLCTLLLFAVIHSTLKKQIKLSKWQWLFVIIELLYFVFVLEMIVGFIEEGSGKAALVMGSLFGFIAILGAILLYRFVFIPKKR